MNNEVRNERLVYYLVVVSGRLKHVDKIPFS